MNRFFSLHFVLPFVIVGVVILHLVALHRFGSNNPIGIDVKGKQDTVPFIHIILLKIYLGYLYSRQFLQLRFSFSQILWGIQTIIFRQMRLQTPAHIVPEWYFLPFYAILRAVPDKLGGVLAMFGAIAVLFVLPWLDRSPVRSGRFRPIFKIFFWLFFADCLVLGYIGAMPAEGIYVLVGRLATVWYFLHFLVFLPVLSVAETPRPLPQSISTPVFGGSGAMAGAAAAPKRKVE